MKILETLTSLNQKVQELTVKVEILEMKLAEKETAEPETLEDELDRHGGTMSDD